MRASRVKAKLRKNEPVLMTALHVIDPQIFELVSLLGFDGIWLDMEHHPTSLETAATLIRAARVGVADVMVRPAKGEFMRIGRMLEIGAQGIMYPRCTNAAEVRELVTWSKFAPLGRRGFDGGNPDMPYCSMTIPEYTQRANDETFLVVQIEDQAAVDQAYDIASVPGVDVVFFGPSDFTILSGIAGEFDHPRVQSAIESVAAAAKRAGKAWGMPSWSVDMTKKLLGMGARFLAHGCDLVMVKTGMEETQRKFGPLGFTFDNRLNAT
jgi:4-hydroxy-2-oxoheptanedioate aldolase